MHALTLEVTAAKARLLAKRKADHDQYMELVDDAEWRSLQAQRAKAEKAITTASNRLRITQVGLHGCGLFGALGGCGAGAGTCCKPLS